MEKRTITGFKKREQIQKANKTMFLWVIAASAAIVVCFVLALSLARQLAFNQKVISVKGETNNTLNQNRETFETIKTEVNKLISDKRLSDLRVSDTDTALQVVIDALPTSDDRAALATSLQQVVLSRSGVTIDSIRVTDDSGAATIDAEDEPADATTPQEITFDVVIVGNYAQVSQAVTDMEKSIRPFSVQRMQIDGSGNQLRVSLQAKTFYLPAKTVNVKQEALKP